MGVSLLFIVFDEYWSLGETKQKHATFSTAVELEWFEDGSDIFWEEAGMITGVNELLRLGLKTRLQSAKRLFSKVFCSRAHL